MEKGSASNLARLAREIAVLREERIHALQRESHEIAEELGAELNRKELERLSLTVGLDADELVAITPTSMTTSKRRRMASKSKCQAQS